MSISRVYCDAFDKDARSTYTIIKAVNGTGSMEVSLVIFPNPNNGQFKIVIEGMNKPSIVIITDMNGRMIKKLNVTNDKPVFISNLVSGTYIVTIPGAFETGKSFSEKVVVWK